MMIMITFVVFALLIGAMGIYLLRHRTGFMGIAASQAKMPATIFGWFFTVDAALLLISVVIYRDPRDNYDDGTSANCCSPLV